MMLGVAALLVQSATAHPPPAGHPPHRSHDSDEYDEYERYDDDSGPRTGSIVGIVLTIGASVGFFIGGGLLLGDAAETMDAVDRGRAGHMPQSEAFDLESEAAGKKTGGGILIGIGGAFVLGAVGILLGEVLRDSRPSRRHAMGFGVTPQPGGGLLTIGGGF